MQIELKIPTLLIVHITRVTGSTVTCLVNGRYLLD